MRSNFIKNENTLDHLVRLESFTRNPITKKQYVTTVFFDRAKAYDATWIYGIINDLNEVGLKGRLSILINNFLKERIFNVSVGTTLSDLCYQEMVVPQGKILSVTLFNVKINSIIICLNYAVACRWLVMLLIEKR